MSDETKRLQPGDKPDHLPGCGPDCYRCALDASPMAALAAERATVWRLREALEHYDAGFFRAENEDWCSGCGAPKGGCSPRSCSSFVARAALAGSPAGPVTPLDGDAVENACRREVKDRTGVSIDNIDADGIINAIDAARSPAMTLDPGTVEILNAAKRAFVHIQTCGPCECGPVSDDGDVICDHKTSCFMRIAEDAEVAIIRSLTTKVTPK